MHLQTFIVKKSKVYGKFLNVQMVYSGISLMMSKISYCAIEIVLFELFFQENIMDSYRFFVKWHVAWDRMVTHAKLQYYKQNYCLVCMTGLLGCRWHRYKQSTRDSRKVIEFNISYSIWKWNVTLKIYQRPIIYFQILFY